MAIDLRKTPKKSEPVLDIWQTLVATIFIIVCEAAAVIYVYTK